MQRTADFQLSESELAAQQGREGNHPFELGRQAATDGLTLEANPFPRRSANALAFRRGWDAVIAEKTSGNGAAQKDEAPQEEISADAKTKAKYVQAVLPGAEGVFDEAIDAAARSYAKARDARMAATKIEVERKTFLIELLQKKEVQGYRCEGVEAEITTGEVKLKVRIKKDDEDNEESED